MKSITVVFNKKFNAISLPALSAEAPELIAAGAITNIAYLSSPEEYDTPLKVTKDTLGTFGYDVEALVGETTDKAETTYTATIFPIDSNIN